MNVRTITRNEAFAAGDKYGALVMLQAKMFTEDDLKAYVVCEDAMWEIPIILSKPETDLSHFSQIMQYVRTKSIQLLHESPYFDPWDLWKQEPAYFSLLPDSTDLNHKEMFWYRYFRDLPDEKIAAKYSVSTGVVEEIVKALLREMTAGMTRYIQEHPVSWNATADNSGAT